MPTRKKLTKTADTSKESSQEAIATEEVSTPDVSPVEPEMTPEEAVKPPADVVETTTEPEAIAAPNEPSAAAKGENQDGEVNYTLLDGRICHECRQIVSNDYVKNRLVCAVADKNCPRY